jgi:4-diphosphocytidyl-2-C-methyl-D-erythritol kinase
MAAIARGVGEVLSPVTVPTAWIALVAPPVEVPTASIFAARELTRNTPSAKINVFADGHGRNDLQPVAVAGHPAIAAALRVLLRHSPVARMTGSGACVFAPLRSREDARAAADEAVAAVPGSRGIVARTLARHPLVAFE